MKITINRDEEYSLDDLEATIAEKNQKNEMIQYTEKEQIADGEVINHMPYNSGLFFDRLENDQDFYIKSLENDMNFANEIFG